MSLRSVVLVAACLGAGLSGCGGEHKTKEPRTAREKLRREAKNESKNEKPDTAKQWGGWRYKGERSTCFFRVGSRCFKTEAAACQVAGCGKPKCRTEGAAPAMVTCAK